MHCKTKHIPTLLNARPSHMSRQTTLTALPSPQGLIPILFWHTYTDGLDTQHVQAVKNFQVERLLDQQSYCALQPFRISPGTLHQLRHIQRYTAEVTLDLQAVPTLHSKRQSARYSLAAAAASLQSEAAPGSACPCGVPVTPVV